MESFYRCLQIFSRSMSVLNREKRLLIFPLISSLALFLLIMSILGYFAPLYPQGPSLMENIDLFFKKINIRLMNTDLIWEFVLYLLTMLASCFCSTAFYHEILEGLQGREVSVCRGFSFACRRFWAILLWALLASTVGMLLDVLSSRSKLAGRIALKILGAVWGVSACFAIPALVVHTETVNPLRILKHSAGTIRRTWGESLVGIFGLFSLNAIGAFAFMGTLAVLGLCCEYRVISCLQLAWLSGSALVLLILYGYIIHTAEQIFRGALYLYSEKIDIDSGFTRNDLENAFISE